MEGGGSTSIFEVQEAEGGFLEVIGSFVSPHGHHLA